MGKASKKEIMNEKKRIEILEGKHLKKKKGERRVCIREEITDENGAGKGWKVRMMGEAGAGEEEKLDRCHMCRATRWRRERKRGGRRRKNKLTRRRKRYKKETRKKGRKRGKRRGGGSMREKKEKEK